MRHAVSIVQSLSQRVSIIQDVEVVIVFTRSGPKAANCELTCEQGEGVAASRRFLGEGSSRIGPLQLILSAGLLTVPRAGLHAGVSG